MQCDQRPQIQALQVTRKNTRGTLLTPIAVNSKDPARLAMDSRVLVTLPRITPVENVDGTIGTVAEIQPSKPRVCGFQHVRFMLPDVSSPFGNQPLYVDSSTMQVKGQQTTTIRFRPVVAQVNRRAAVSVASPQSIVLPSHFPRISPILAGIPVVVIGMSINRHVHVRVRIFTVWPTIMSPRNDLPQMAIDRIDEKSIPVLVPVVSPGIGGSMTKDFDDRFHGV